MFKILDCTLRDGGYYTNWDFSPEVIDAYIQAMRSEERRVGKECRSRWSPYH